MLGKVMKYEFKASGRLLLPLFGVALVLSALLRLLLLLVPAAGPTGQGFIQGAAMLLGVLAVMAVAFLTTAVLVMRFYQSMSSREAYISFTLPVSANTHIIGRTIVGTVYLLAGAAVTLACLSIFLPGFDIGVPWGALVRDIFIAQQNLFQHIGVSPFAFYALGVANLLVSTIGGLLLFYASIAVGTQFRSRVGGSVLAYIILNSVQGIVTMVFTLVPFLTTFFNAVDGQQQMVYNSGGTAVYSTFSASVFSTFNIIALVLSVVFTVAFYLVTHYCFTKRLNLQ